mgnify:CR=1 FL=1
MKSVRSSEGPNWLNFSLPASLEAVDGICCRTKEWLRAKGLERGWFEVQLLLREALNNCVLHGCRSDPEQEVRLEISLQGSTVRIAAEDQGEGFAWKECLGSAPSLPLDGESGMGLTILRLYADSMDFNEKGNRVVLSKRI